MTLNRILLGSVAALAAAGTAQAADLPVRKAAPVEYVRVCTAYGAGFFYIPGTDTCLRIGGRARFEYQYTSQRARTNTDTSGMRALGRLNLDTRSQTAYGTLRTFVRFDIASRTGGYLTSGTQQRFGNAFPALGQDTFGHVQKYVDVDKAFIQFAGFTAGRTSSFFDFYAHDVEMIGSSIGSDANTNLLAYTAMIGHGFAATVSVEDPTARRNPVYGAGFSAFGGTAPTTPISGRNGVAALDVRQTNVMPDVVGLLRYDASWGAAQVSGAVHEIRTGNYTGLLVGDATGMPRTPSAEYGFAVQGGLKLNIPHLAPGDVLWLQAAYGRGAGSYTGVVTPQGSEALGNTYTNRFGGSNLPGGFDAAVDTNGKMHLTDSMSATVAFTHYWTPEIRSSVFGSYGLAHFDKALRGPASPVLGPFLSIASFSAPTAAGGLYSGYGRDYSNLYVGANTAWSPVKDFEVGAEVSYERIEFLGGASKGRVIDTNKNQIVNGVARTVKADDNFLARIRVQRDF